MYASNEDEDWVYLHETLRISPTLQKHINVIDSKHSSSPSLSNCSSTSDSSSNSSRSVSLSSITSADLTNYHYSEDEIPSLERIQNENTQIDSIHQQLSPHELLSTKDDKSTLPCQSFTSHDDDDSTLVKNINVSQTMNEEHVLNSQVEPNKTLSLTNSTSSSNSSSINLHCRKRSNTQKTNWYEIVQSVPICEQIKERKISQWNEHKNNKLPFFICIILCLTVPFILGHVIIRWDQSAINKIAEELVKINQRLNNLKNVPIINTEEKLTKQIDEKLQNIIHQQSIWHDHQKYALNLQIQDLQQIVMMTQENFTATIHQLIEENAHLKQHIKSLENRLEINQEEDTSYPKTCIKGVNCTKSTQHNVVSTAGSTATNVSGIFEYLRAKFSHIVDHRYEYLKKTKQKLTYIVGSSAVKKLRTSLISGLDNLSLSVHRTKLAYITWLKSRSKHHQPNQIKPDVKEKLKRIINKRTPSRWAFRYGFNRARKWHQATSKKSVCYSRSKFPMNQICLIKNWITKFFSDK